MTAQLDDVFRYNDTSFSVAGISEGVLFEPRVLDLKPVDTCTACWRGYQAIFALSGSRLVLHTLHVNLFTEGEVYERQEGPPINGVTPTGPRGEDDWFNNHYVGIEYHLKYTGGLLLADGFIDDLYVHMGFHPAWKYTHVVELLFTKGVLQRKFDRSARMTELRQTILDSGGVPDSSRMSSDEDIREFIKRSFDRTYSL